MSNPAPRHVANDFANDMMRAGYEPSEEFTAALAQELRVLDQVDAEFGDDDSTRTYLFRALMHAADRALSAHRTREGQ